MRAAGRRRYRSPVPRPDLRPRQLAFVGALAAVLVVDSILCPDGNPSVVGVLAVALAVLPLLWRDVAPRTALGFVLLGILACLLTLKPVDTAGLPGCVATYAVARHSDRLRSLLVGLVAVPFALGCVVVFSDGNPRPTDLIMNGAIVLLAAALGDAVRSRAAYREAGAQRDAERAREQRAEAVAEERLRIAREVHDVVAHAMVAINVQAGVAAHLIDQRPEQARSALHEIKATSGAALTDLRATLGLLREEGEGAPVRPTECLSAVPELAAPLRAAGIEVDVRVEGPEERVPAAVGAAAYRIVQEAATNILRHAGARRASIHVVVGPGGVDVLVDDDGAALVPVGGPVAAGSGNGLRGMAERAGTLGGRLDAGPHGEAGWRVHAVLPLA